MSLVSAMALGADCIEDCDIPRSGQTGAVLGHRVAAPSTLGTFSRAFTFGHVRQLDRMLAAVLGRAWSAGAGPGDDRLVVDVDSFVAQVHGYAQPGRRDRLHPQARYHPILATREGTGEVLHVRLREGQASITRGALHFVEDSSRGPLEPASWGRDPPATARTTTHGRPLDRAAFGALTAPARRVV